MAVPTYKSAGTEQASTGTNLTVPWPTHVAGDIALMLVECCGGQAASLATANGFVELANSPQATGTTTNGTRIHAYWCRATSGAMSSPVVTPGANHGYARIFTFDGDIPSAGNPFQVTSGGVKAGATTTTTWTDLTTLSNNCLLLFVAARDNDSASAAWSSFAGGNVTGHTEVSGSDSGTALGNGGGIVLNTGVMATAGTVGTPTATVTSSINAMMTIALSSVHPDVIAMVSGSNCREVCDDADYVYYCTDSNPAYVGRISKIDWVTKDELNTGVTNLNSICQDANNIYAASYEAPCRVVKISKSSFTVTSTKTLAAGENNCRRMTQDATYVYMGLDLSPSRCIRLQKADWTTNSSKTFAAGENFCNAIDIDATYIYVGHYISPAKVSRLLISDFSTTSTFTADSGYNSCMSLVNDTDYVYAGVSTTPTRMVRINKSDWSTKQNFMGDADQGDTRMAMGTTEKFYAVYDNTPGKMSHFLLSDGVTHQRTEFVSPYQQCQTPCADDDYVYVPIWNSPVRIVRVPIRLPVEQEGFRWRDDNGSETTATWLAAQDVNLTRVRSLNTRLRILLDMNANQASNQYKLQYKKTTDTEWFDVRPNYSGNFISETFASTPDQTLIEIGADAVWNAGGYLQLTTAANDKKGWMGYIGVLPDDFVTTFDIYANGTADGINFYFGCTGNDGNAEQANGGYHCFYDEYHGEVALWFNGTKLTSTAVASMGDGTFRTARVERIGGTRFKMDIAGVNKIDYTDSARTLIGKQFGWGARTGGLNAEHRYKNVTLYSASYVQAIVLSPSGNITASGETTTFQLAAPSGKSTANFIAGRMQDDENPPDAVEIMETEYTEMEWCLMATTDATIGATYEFRVVEQDTPVVLINPYTVNPQWTIDPATPPFNQSLYNARMIRGLPRHPLFNLRSMEMISTVAPFEAGMSESSSRQYNRDMRANRQHPLFYNRNKPNIDTGVNDHGDMEPAPERADYPPQLLSRQYFKSHLPRVSGAPDTFKTIPEAEKESSAPAHVRLRRWKTVRSDHVMEVAEDTFADFYEELLGSMGRLIRPRKNVQRDPMQNQPVDNFKNIGEEYAGSTGRVVRKSPAPRGSVVDNYPDEAPPVEEEGYPLYSSAPIRISRRGTIQRPYTDFQEESFRDLTEGIMGSLAPAFTRLARKQIRRDDEQNPRDTFVALNEAFEISTSIPYMVRPRRNTRGDNQMELPEDTFRSMNEAEGSRPSHLSTVRRRPNIRQDNVMEEPEDTFVSLVESVMGSLPPAFTRRAARKMIVDSNQPQEDFFTQLNEELMGSRRLYVPPVRGMIHRQQPADRLDPTEEQEEEGAGATQMPPARRVRRLFPFNTDQIAEEIFIDISTEVIGSSGHRRRLAEPMRRAEPSALSDEIASATYDEAWNRPILPRPRAAQRAMIREWNNYGDINILVYTAASRRRIRLIINNSEPSNRLAVEDSAERAVLIVEDSQQRLRIVVDDQKPRQRLAQSNLRATERLDL